MRSVRSERGKVQGLNLGIFQCIGSEMYEGVVVGQRRSKGSACPDQECVRRVE